MLLLVTALNNMVQSSYKKLDIFGLKESGIHLIINLRIEYNNGSVVNLTLSQEKSMGCFEIFEQSHQTKFEFQEPLYVLYPHVSHAYTSVEHFIRLISSGDKKTSAFDNLLNGVQIVQEIREHLRFVEIDF
jgi:hypothetical protein